MMRRKRRTFPHADMGQQSVDDIPRQQLGWYVRNCALSPAAGILERVMLERLDRLNGCPESSHWDLFDSDTSLEVKSLTHRRSEFRQALKRYSAPPQSEESLELNVRFMFEEFVLDEVDANILLLLLRYEHNSDLEQFADEVLHRLRDASRAIAVLLGIDRREAQRRIAADSPLFGSGLLYVCESGWSSGLAGEAGYLRISRFVRTAMYRSFCSRQEWAAAIIGTPLATSLIWDDFEHLSPTRELAMNVIVGAGKAAAKGVNLLLHGPVGTGKTEFAKALAMRTGMSIWSIGETDREGSEPTRGERLAALICAQRLLAKRANVLVLLDEAEDILASETPLFGPFASQSHDQSKVYINRMIEQNPVPIIWTCNNTGGIDPAILRRMTLAVEVKTPSQPVRARIWRRVLDEAGVKLGADAVQRLSSRYLAPPAVAANAARAAALSGGGEAALEQAMGGVLQLLGIGPCIANADARDFDPSLVNCETDLARLMEWLVRPGASRQWSLCLSGPPGTGKSQFARRLAQRLGMEVMQQRASDLLSYWIGESEKQIAAAFQTARTRRAMLVIDEADSLLSDRREAVRNWEVTQVNEMLTWMESHPLPFVCTTNLMDRLDRASLRRFTLKLRFEPLHPDQAALAFARFFGIAAPRRLADGLTPGDFAIVGRKRELLGVADPSVLANWLDEEAEAKGARVQPIGFVAARG